MSYRIQFHISPVHTSTSSLFRFEQPTAQPQKGDAEKQETEAACDKKNGYKYKRGSISSTSNTACSSPGVVTRETPKFRNIIQLKQ